MVACLLRNDDNTLIQINLPAQVTQDLTLLAKYLNENKINDDGKQVDDLPSSSSWDVGVATSPSGSITRPPPDKRNELRKEHILRQDQRIQRLEERELERYEEEIMELEESIKESEAELEVVVAKVVDTELIGRYEVTDRVLQAFNDRIYDVEHVIPNNGPRTSLTREEKEELKRNKYNFITRLLTVQSKNKRIATLVSKALSCLSSNELDVCKALCNMRDGCRHARNTSSHPVPSITEAQQYFDLLEPPAVRKPALKLLESPTQLRRLPDTHHNEVDPVALFRGVGEAGTLRLHEVRNHQKATEEHLQRKRQLLIKKKQVLERVRGELSK